jgi:NADH-quinone oxidoreductase subunit H
VFGITLLTATYSSLAERKVAGFLQDRLGPDRAGPFGIFQPLADAVKMFFKEEFIPSAANKWLFIAGPCIAITTALMTSAVIPFGDVLEIGGEKYKLQGMEINIGILYVFGVVSLGVYGLMVGGWASNNKFSLLGAIRAASQNISYELAMGLSIISILMMTGSLDLNRVVQDQAGWNGMAWNVFYQPVACIIFIVCAFAECNRTPFDLPECETELVGGYHTEYTSMKLGFYLFAEYINMFVSSAVIATLFFGGYNFPGQESLRSVLDGNIITLIGTVVFLGKILFFIFFFMWVRWTLPRFRYDQLMGLGWKSLLPLSILNVMITGAVLLFLGK